MEIIHQYTRSQALADGVLVDVTSTAREAGLRYPVALTSSVWQRYVRVPEGLKDQDERGRLWDILWMLRFHILSAQPNSQENASLGGLFGRLPLLGPARLPL